MKSTFNLVRLTGNNYESRDITNEYQDRLVSCTDTTVITFQ
ncbi:hypothetical protein [Hymenobacter algoricola]